MSGTTTELGQSDSQPSLTDGASCSTEESGDGPLGQKEDKEIHPLLIDLILESVLKHTRRIDLMACRGVCKKWNVLTIPFMRSYFGVSIYGNQNKDKYQRNRRIGDFVETFKSNLFGIPFEKFRLGAFPMTDGAGKVFLQLCGDTAKEVHLHDLSSRQIYEEDYRIDNITEILSSSPNLEFFGFPWNLLSRDHDVVKLFPTLLPKLTSLRKIDIITRSGAQQMTFCRQYFGISIVSAVLKVIENRGMESSIESLQVILGKKEHVGLLRRMSEKPDGLKLKKLFFYADRNGDEDFDTTQLATIFKDSLEHLVLKETIFTSFNQFPRMPHLKSLSFCVSRSFNSIPVNLNDFFPALESLDLDFAPAENDDVHVNKFFSQIECSTRLKSLKHSGRYTDKCADIIDICAFNKILVTFPNLTKLYLHIGNDGVEVEILKKIWVEMTQLEDLTFHSPLRNVENLDSVFTGIPINTIKEIGNLDIFTDLEEMAVEARGNKIEELMNHYCKTPGIRNLTKLRRLDLWVTSEFHGVGATGFTDLSGYLTFYTMSRLNHLRLWPSCEFTNTCCEILTTDMGLESWSFDTSNPQLKSDIRCFL